jgi:Domain of unknown function (DUF4062)
MMQKVYQVFVSSTYADLTEERRRVSETLAKAGFIPAGMELFPAADQRQLDFIKRVIDRCDYYVVIVGGRYGSLADDNVSFTEKEYAVSRHIPILAFLHGSPEKIEVGKTDRDNSKATRLEAFRNRLAQDRIVDFWSDPLDLCTKIVIAVTQAVNLSPGIGWIRGDQAVDAKVLQEAERLRIENVELKKRLSENEIHEIKFPPHLAGPDTMFDFDITITATKAGTLADQVDTGAQNKLVTARIGDVFVKLFDRLLTTPSEYRLREAIGRAVTELGLGPPESNRRYEISLDQVMQLRFQLEALGLITAEGVPGTRPYMEYIVWAITEKGRRYVTQIRAIPKSTLKAALSP